VDSVADNDLAWGTIGDVVGYIEVRNVKGVALDVAHVGEPAGYAGLVGA
jgi:hypothetical protein